MHSKQQGTSFAEGKEWAILFMCSGRWKSQWLCGAEWGNIQLSYPKNPSSSVASVARPVVYVYTARLGVARQAPAEVERRAQGSQLVPSSTHHMTGAPAKKVLTIAHTVGVTERL